MSPSHVQAYINLADLYRLQNREEEGEQLLRDGLARLPEAGELHHALGLLLARTERLEEALKSLGRAAELRSDNVRFGYVYGIGLHSAGDVAGSLAALDRTHRRHPNDPDVLLALATIHRDAGNPAMALNYARHLLELDPQHGRVLQLVRQLESRAAHSE
jgi:Flp pilus assembly protein TadD